jgi:serine phosphatase RsbU (regulator of sigma subunit)
VHHEPLERGDVVVLYTDGVVERRHEPIDDGLDRLRLVGEALADLGPEDFCKALVEAMVPAEEQTDDIAVLAMRFDGPPR